MYINKVFLYGNLTRDPELKSLPSGTQVCEFGLATNSTWKDKEGNKQESVEFHNIVMFGRQAEVAAQYLSKGRPAFIEGRIRTRSWDGQDGNKKYRTEVVVEKFQFGPQAGGGQQGQYSSNPNEQEPSKGDGPSSKNKEEGGIDYPEEEINPDDIPF